MSRPTAGRGRPLDAAVTPAILDAALAELARVGFEGLRLEQVARRAKVAKTSLYRRWPSKDALVADAVTMFLRDRGPLEAAARDEGSLRADWLAHGRRLLQVLTPQRVAVLVGLLLAIRTRPALAALVRRELVQAERLAVEAIVARARQRGELPAQPPAPAATQVLASMLLTQLVVNGSPVSDAGLVELVDRVVLPVLLAPQPSVEQSRRRLPRGATHK